MFLISVTEKNICINTVDMVVANNEPPLRTTINIGGTPVSFNTDSGADTSIMTETTYNGLR